MASQAPLSGRLGVLNREPNSTLLYEAFDMSTAGWSTVLIGSKMEVSRILLPCVKLLKDATALAIHCFASSYSEIVILYFTMFESMNI